MRVLFVHGLLSSPQGTKALYLAERFEARTPAMSVGDFVGCVSQQAAEIDSFKPDVVIGSSFGGAVVFALLPCIAMATYNTGYQALLAMAQGAVPLDSWQATLYQAAGLPFDFKNPIACVIYGLLHYGPILAACMLTGGVVEPFTAMIREH